jgi:hypothetical protein
MLVQARSRPRMLNGVSPHGAVYRRCRGRPSCMYRLLFANDFWHALGSRSYVSGLLIDTRVVALLGLRSHRGLISGQVDDDHQGRQTLGA